MDFKYQTVTSLRMVAHFLTQQILNSNSVRAWGYDNEQDKEIIPYSCKAWTPGAERQ